MRNVWLKAVKSTNTAALLRDKSHAVVYLPIIMGK